MKISPSQKQTGQLSSHFLPREATLTNYKDQLLPQSGAKVLIARGATMHSVKRLVVLAPNVDMDDVKIAREVWEMAALPRLTVLLLSLCDDKADELYIQRRLINLAALIRDPRITVETHIERGNDWLRSIKSIFTEGDVVLCHAEQYVGWKPKPLAMLLDSMQIPVWTLSGIHPAENVSQPRWLSSIVFWSVAAAILAAFFYLQVQINTLPDAVSKNVMLVLSVMVEVGSLWGWNSIFS